ncbi:hypothetical protein NP493_893g00001 [Ridgeia piscesae]|uniref:Uncharacterized protein n=1 Tax=Ridgeia piscesae TaxID=27915 RepID=A0AAD9KKC7_RIDPI|nr:hypothetical protein NP493_893g00001 [Ridgeia piscesae]
MFKQKDKHKTTWMYPRTRHWHMMDIHRPQYPSHAWNSYELKRPSPPERVLQTRITRSTTAAYKDACRLLQKRNHASQTGGQGRQWSCRKLLTETT